MRREELQDGFCDRSPEDATGGFVAGGDRTGARIARGAAFLSGKPLIAYPRLYPTGRLLKSARYAT